MRNADLEGVVALPDGTFLAVEFDGKGGCNGRNSDAVLVWATPSDEFGNAIALYKALGGGQFRDEAREQGASTLPGMP